MAIGARQSELLAQFSYEGQTQLKEISYIEKRKIKTLMRKYPKILPLPVHETRKPLKIKKELNPKKKEHL